MFVANFGASDDPFARYMAFEYDGFLIYHRVHIWLVGDPMLVWACIAESVRVDIGFLFCHYSLNQ